MLNLNNFVQKIKLNSLSVDQQLNWGEIGNSSCCVESRSDYETVQTDDHCNSTCLVALPLLEVELCNQSLHADEN